MGEEWRWTSKVWRGGGERRVMKWRRERGNVDGRRGRNDRIKETGGSHVLSMQ